MKFIAQIDVMHNKISLPYVDSTTQNSSIRDINSITIFDKQNSVITNQS
jgi:hypothetical protein